MNAMATAAKLVDLLTSATGDLAIANLLSLKQSR
jgi:hypothetical protein